MKAIALTHYLPIDDPDSLFDTELDSPVATGHDLLINVTAVSVNPVDCKVRAPKEQIETEPKILGWDACGIVSGIGDSVSLFEVGDRVFYAGDISRPGSNCEYQLVDEKIVGRAPETLSDEAVAAVPLTAITAWEALFDRLGVSLDEDNTAKTILIIGGAGGVGSIAVQLASRLAGLTVIATASKEKSVSWCEGLGAAEVINHHQPIPEQLNALGYHQVDYILCLNDTDMHFAAMVEVIKPQGVICSVVDNKQPLDMSTLKSKSVGFVWEFMFTRAMYQTDDRIEQHHLLNEVARLLDEGILKSTLTESFKPITAENLRKAHAKVETGDMVGKLVLSGWS